MFSISAYFPSFELDVVKKFEAFRESCLCKSPFLLRRAISERRGARSVDLCTYICTFQARVVVSTFQRRMDVTFI